MFNHLWLTVVATIVLASVETNGGQNTAVVPLPPLTICAVGDIMDPANPEAAEKTGRLMRDCLTRPNSIGILLGDMAQHLGTRPEYELFDKSEAWAPIKDKVYVVGGNHDYFESVRMNIGVVPYYYYYFPNSGRLEDGYYALDGGSWLLMGINTEIMRKVDGKLTKRGQDQLAWIEATLRSNHNSKSILAFMHRPPFSSANDASPAFSEQIFRLLHQYGVDLILYGHEHFFAAMPRISPPKQGKPGFWADPSHGAPSLFLGTGGGRLFAEPKIKKFGELIVANALGIGRIELSPCKYDWRFLPVDPTRPSPQGSGYCHENPTGW